MAFFLPLTYPKAFIYIFQKFCKRFAFTALYFCLNQSTNY